MMRSCGIKNVCCLLMGAGWLLSSALAQAAKDYVVAPTGGDITGAALSAQLATASVTLNSSSGSKTGSGNVIINDVVEWSANTTLTLVGSNNININANIKATGATAGMVISPNTANGNEQPSNQGSYNLDSSITLSGATPALTISGASYIVINSLGVAADATTAPVTPTLQGMAATANLGKNFALGSNIDASATATWNSNTGFTPIGNWGVMTFSGTLDGLGHVISNLVIKQAPLPGYDNGSQIGLFGTTETGSVIKNVGLINCSINGNTTGSNTIGGLVGMSSSAISNSFVMGSVMANNQGLSDVIGGLAGMSFGSISSSYFAGNVSDPNPAVMGGLAGTNSGGTITSSYAIISMNDDAAQAGGLVGVNSGTITSSYAIGNIACSWCDTYNNWTSVGGLVGTNCSTANNPAYCGAGAGTVSNSYAAVSSNGGAILVGLNAGTVSNSYWNSDLSSNGVATNTGTLTNVVGLGARDMRHVRNFVGFDFTTPIWVLVNVDGTLNNVNDMEGATFPMLASEYSTSINNAHQLQLMAMQPSASYKVNAPINATGTSGSGDIWSKAGFVPVGSFSAPFSGAFNGKENAITNFSINAASIQNAGLFGVTANNAVVKNTNLMSGTVTSQGGMSAGSLIGINNGTVKNSSSSVAVVGSHGGFIGGLIGSNNGTISNSSASGNVSGVGGFRGGLVGFNSGTLNTCTATGTVSGQGGFTGGLAAYNTGTID